MEDGAPVFDATQELDLMDELLSGRCWLETAGCSELLELGTPNSWSPLISSGFSPVFDIGDQDDVERLGFPSNQSSNEIQVEGLNSGIPKYPNPSSEAGASWWIQPGGPAISMKERLRHALSYIKESQQFGDVLVQIWMPVKRGEKQVLTTYGQPFSLNHNCQSLANYRTISMGYQFSAEEGSSEARGLPGRVFLGRVPEWTPDAQYFSSDEYPRVIDARRCDVRGTIAIPIFERDSRSCIGVVELVTTAQKVNYSSDIENMCNALQAVNLRSSDVLSILPIKVSNNTYEAALPEIREVLRTACNLHRLPLAQTWISCIQQGKRGSRHSDENYKQCISTFDDACFVNDPYMLSFHEACSEHHLLRGEGVVGKAFTTNQPCFSSDITSFSKIEYPLSHHAKLFHLRAAVAIRLRSIHTDNADFVLEFFLPVDCKGDEEQKLMLSSLSTTIRQVCQSLRIVTAKELEDEAPPQAPKLILSKGKSVYREGSSFLSAESPSYVPLEYNDQGIERFSASAHYEGPEVVGHAGKLSTEFKQHQQDSVQDTIDHKDSFPGDGRVVNATKASEKKQTKSEKTVSVQVLRQYFAGSLKDAAKSLGVCPTTLKRICRQHGITRWPSRKIKKVDHSLRKLQVVIDSVQGAQGPFQLSSLYQNLTKAPGPEKDLPTLNQKDDPECSIARQQGMTSASNSLSSSSCSQSSSSGGTKRSSEAPPELEVKQEAPLEEENQNQSQYGNMLKVKASFGGERIRFRLQPNWGFGTLKQEIVRRFSIHDIESVCLKYLDDDAEWVLLTCDADLEECVDVYKSSDAYTIKISVHRL